MGSSHSTLENEGDEMSQRDLCTATFIGVLFIPVSLTVHPRNKEERKLGTYAVNTNQPQKEENSICSKLHESEGDCIMLKNRTKYTYYKH